MKLRKLLADKGAEVYSISPDATVDDVVQQLVQHNVGSLVVCEPGSTQLLGIITERDILRISAARLGPLDALRVRDHMTTDVVTGSPDDTVRIAMGLMTDRRVRHLPVVEDGSLVGMISIGDLVKRQHDEMAMENHHLRTYLHG